MVDPRDQDEDLALRVQALFRLWNDIRWLFRELPKPVRVGKLSPRWVTSPPVRNIVPRLITKAATQPIDALEAKMIMDGLKSWSSAYMQLVAISALPRDQRAYEMYSEATETLGQCAISLRMAATSLRRSQHRRRGQHRG